VERARYVEEIRTYTYPSQREDSRCSALAEARNACGYAKGLSRKGGSECCEAGLLEGDEAAGELEEREVVFGFLRPADQDRAVAVEPGVACLGDPAACFPVGLAGLELDLFAAGADVRRQCVVLGEAADFGVVVGLVETEALGRFRGRDRTLDRDRVESALQQEVIVAVGALVVEPDRDAPRFGEDRPLRPFLARSVGFGPVFAPPRGALVIAPSAASHDQSIPTTPSYSTNP